MKGVGYFIEKIHIEGSEIWVNSGVNPRAIASFCYQTIYLKLNVFIVKEDCAAVV